VDPDEGPGITGRKRLALVANDAQRRVDAMPVEDQSMVSDHD